MIRAKQTDAGQRRPAPRFFVPDGLARGAEIRLPARAARHVAVLRLQPEDELTLFDGTGGEFHAVLSRLDRAGATARIGDPRDVERESPLTITLAQCVSSGDRMDLALQKATELGVSAIIPLASERALVRVSGERAGRKLEHWRNVVFAACEQCGRNRPPLVHPMTELHPWLASLPTEGLRLLLAPEAKHSLAGIKNVAPSDSITLLAGPEGGLAPHERMAAERHGFVSLRLGPRILRTETAPLAAIAALQTLWGDLGGSR